jgi:hypothetical protein
MMYYIEDQIAHFILDNGKMNVLTPKTYKEFYHSLKDFEINPEALESFTAQAMRKVGPFAQVTTSRISIVRSAPANKSWRHSFSCTRMRARNHPALAGRRTFIGIVGTSRS